MSTNGQEIIFKKAGLQAKPSSFTGSYVLDLHGAGEIATNPVIDAAHNTGLGGINIGNGATHLNHPTVVHFAGNAICMCGAAGDEFVIDPYVTEWNNSDPAFLTDSNFVGTGIYTNRHDD